MKKMIKRKIVAGILSAAIAVQCFSGTNLVFAKDTDAQKEKKEITIENIVNDGAVFDESEIDLPANWDSDDPMSYRVYLQQQNALTDNQEVAYNTLSEMGDDMTTMWDGKTYTHSNNLRKGAVSVGIDVSKWNGSINWTKVKQAGIDFAMIRLGNSGHEKGTKNKDPYFEANYTGATAAGLQVGIYYYSQAITVAEAQAEAQYVLSILNARKLDLPVAFDYENVGSTDTRLYKAHLSSSRKTAICRAFCDTILANGYDAWVYSGSNWLETQLDGNLLQAEYGLWMAKYSSNSFTPNYAGQHFDGQVNMWQCTSSAKVSGISGNVDLNFLYEGYGDAISRFKYQVPVVARNGATESAAILKWNYIPGALGYEVAYCTSRNGTYTRLGTTTNTYCTIPNLSANREYYVKVRAYREDGDGKQIFSKQSAVLPIQTTRNTVIKYTNKKNEITMRTWAGTAYATKVSIPKNSVITKLYNVKDNTGATWYHVTCTVNSKKYEGYIPSGNLSYYVGKVGSVKQTAQSTSAITLSWGKVSEADGYYIYRSTAKNGKYSKIKTIKDNTVLKYKDGKRTAGTEYYYKVQAYRNYSGTSIKTGTASSVVTMHTKKSSTLKVKTTSSVNMRSNAGTAYSKKVVVPKGKKFSVIYKTKDKSGTTWYKIKYTVNGKSYTGYISSKYAKKVS